MDTKPVPYAVCRYCRAAITRTELVAIFPRSRSVAHLVCNRLAERAATGRGGAA